PEFIANLPFTACHTLPSEIIVMHYTITPFGMSSKLSLSPNTPIIDSYKGILAVKSGNGSASGVGIQLAWGTQSAPSPQWVNFAESRQFFLPDDGSTQYSLPLMARYIQTASQVMPGKADATVTFTIYYY
ncbi:fimbrial protein, partial [Erwinia mallotivora]|uniref:fimbrial protein n=1 Tax=Erwinia mallotivora TaxID=69222 RepID=UPI0035EBE605